MAQYKITAALKEEIENRLVDGVSDVGIRKTDEIDGLECYCSDSPPFDKFEQKIRGHVFNGDRLILKSLPYGKNLKSGESESEIGDLKKYKITQMREGSIIRVFNFENKWYITTHRKLDAFKSKWGNGESFGEIFKDNVEIKTWMTFEEFLEGLDSNLSYFFICGTTEITRCVAPASRKITLIKAVDRSGNEVFCENLKNWYEKTYEFDSFEALTENVRDMKYPFDEGYGYYLTSEEGNFKIYNDDYLYYFELRNNSPSIPFAYLHNVFEEQKNSDFRKMYPEHTETFDFYDKEIKEIAKDLQSKYVKRFVLKQNFVVPKYEHAILYAVHGIFIQKREPTTDSTVIEAMKKVPISNVNKIINDRKKAKKMAEKSQ